MRIKAIIILLLACVLAMFAVAGCGSSSSSSDGTKTITDSYGRNVEVPADVTTCATVGSAARFVVYAGGQDMLIAVTDLDKAASIERPYTIAYEGLFSTLPSTSNGNHLMETSVDGEALLELAPDVIISSRSAQECDDLQNQIGIPVVGISYGYDMFGEDITESIQIVADTLGTVDHASNVINKLTSWQADLDSRTANIADADKPTCYAGAVNYKGRKSFGGTYAQYPPFTAVHILNVADEATDSGSVEVTLEQLGEWNPDFMFLNAGNMELMKKDYSNNTAFFNNLEAFKNGNLYTQPSYIMNGMNVGLGICDTYFNGAMVYPEAFEDVDLEAQYKEILEVVLGVDCYDELHNRGISFEKISF